MDIFILFIIAPAVLLLFLYFSKEVDILRTIAISRFAKKYKLQYSLNGYFALTGAMPEKWRTNILKGVIHSKHINIYDEHTTQNSRDMGIDPMSGVDGPLEIIHTIITVDGHKVLNHQGRLSATEIEQVFRGVIHGDTKTDI